MSGKQRWNEKQIKIEKIAGAKKRVAAILGAFTYTDNPNTCFQQLFDCALDFNKYLVNISPKLGSSTSNVAGDSTSVDGDAITRVILCSGEIPSSKEPRSVLFFVFVSDIEF